jgi:hypothetical protein
MVFVRAAVVHAVMKNDGRRRAQGEDAQAAIMIRATMYAAPVRQLHGEHEDRLQDEPEPEEGVVPDHRAPIIGSGARRSKPTVA